jgi:hypothetical protein
MDTILVGSTEALEQRWVVQGAAFVMPFVDALSARRAARLLSDRSGAAGTIIAVHDDARDGFVKVANVVFERTESLFFGYLAQDAYAGRNWLKFAMLLLNSPEANLVAFNDGKWFGRIAAFGLARTAWARTNYGGLFFHPGYGQHYADVELSMLAAATKGLRYAANSVVLEVDWNKDQKPTNRDDELLFRQRVRSGFDGRIKAGRAPI